MHKFSQALLAGKLGSLKTVAEITKGKIAMPMPPTPPNAKPMPEMKYGFGFGEVYQNNVRITGHNGGAPGVSAHLSIYPDLGYTVVVLSNYDVYFPLQLPPQKLRRI
jgi:D-alanyl-D-alanine carboxypeptidase